MPITSIILGFIAGIFLRIYSMTFRYEVEFEEDYLKNMIFTNLSKRNVVTNKNYIFACWHQDEISLFPFFAYQKIYIMVSPSKDGSILATALKILGYNLIRGSSSRNAISSLKKSIRVLKDGYHISTAADGPKGPAFIAKNGFSRMAEVTKKFIIPVKAYPKKYYLFEKSWDKEKLPLPFSKIKISIGKEGFYSAKELTEKLNSI